MVAAPNTLIDLQALIADAADLEPLPDSVSRLQGVLARSEWSLEDIVDVVRFDAPLTARLLRVANSAAFAPPAPVTDLRRAVMQLGATQVVSIATATAVRRQLHAAVPEYGISEGQLWRHSVAAALAADALGRLARVAVPTEAFVTALLHDIGTLVLARHLNPEVLAFLGRAADEGALDRLRAESELLSVNHAELGALIAQSWRLPESIVKGIMYHHTPEATEPVEHTVLAHVTFLADHTADRVGAGLEPARMADGPRTEAALQALRVPESGLETLCARVSARLEEVLRWYE